MKTCKTCKQLKPLEEFAKNKNCAGGHLTECKECNRIYRQENAARRAGVEKARRRRLGIKEKVTFSTDEERKQAHIRACIRWREKNNDTYKEYQQAYRDSNKEHRYALIQEWRRLNKGRVNALTAKRRAHLNQATPAWVDYLLILQLYEQAQEVTETTGMVHVVDHYYPLQGRLVCGLHVHENLQIITYDENARKHNKHPDEFYNT